MTKTIEEFRKKYYFVPTEEEIAAGPAEYSQEKSNDIQSDLDQCIGTTRYFAYNGYNLTDGAKAMADSCKAFWLFDVIISHQLSRHVRRETFQHWQLKPYKASQGALVLCDDGNDNLLVAQHIPFTDFPLPKGIKLFVRNGVIFLPSEY